MDLWIRSQNKEIFRKANYLKIENRENGFAITEQATLYGEYKTKERALEILDDIQDFIKVEIDVKGTSVEIADLYIKGAILESTQKIYTMPKE